MTNYKEFCDWKYILLAIAFVILSDLIQYGFKLREIFPENVLVVSEFVTIVIAIWIIYEGFKCSHNNFLK